MRAFTASPSSSIGDGELTCSRQRRGASIVTVSLGRLDCAAGGRPVVFLGFDHCDGLYRNRIPRGSFAPSERPMGIEGAAV